MDIPGEDAMLMLMFMPRGDEASPPPPKKGGTNVLFLGVLVLVGRRILGLVDWDGDDSGSMYKRLFLLLLFLGSSG